MKAATAHVAAAAMTAAAMTAAAMTAAAGCLNFAASDEQGRGRHRSRSEE
jgi:hypothetical protein